MGLKICSPQLGLSPESNSGGEVYDQEVINRLCQAGVKVLTLLPKNRPYIKHKNLTIEYTSIKSIFPPQIFSAFVLPYLIKTYKKEQFDILRVHNPYFVGPGASVFKKLYPQVPIVAVYHHLEEGINHLIDKIVSRNFDSIISVSNFTKTEIVNRLNYPVEKISVIYNGADSRFQPGKKKKGKFTIMFIGGLKPRKNPGFLLKVLVKLNRPEVQLIYVGGGPLLQNLKRKTKNLKLENQVQFTDFVSETDKLNWYHQADVVVLPSLKEGFGMTLTEAGACGLPVIGNNHSSIREIIQEGQTGFLAKTNDINDWVDKLIQLIKSPQLCQKMGLAGSKLVSAKFTWTKNIEAQIKVYESLVS